MYQFHNMIHKNFKMTDLLSGLISWLLFSVIEAKSNSTDSGRFGGLTDDMIKGLSAGFGFFIALIFLICLVWYCCCAEPRDSENVKWNTQSSNNQNSSQTNRRQHVSNTSSSRTDENRNQNRRVFA
ncbi:uncharacterized protein [Mytilus edulis]|uniref:uncharacterized protein n=1 Tax=Mytilus edulis TaxID=6550 RepID=UPI0039EF8EFA